MWLRQIIMASTLLLLACSAAIARPANDVTTNYYSDPQHTKWIGSTELTCGGGRISFGRRSQYYTRQSDSCGDHRVGVDAVKAYGASRLPPLQVCYSICDRKYGRPGMCLPDGTCPDREALDACLDTCKQEYATP